MTASPGQKKALREAAVDVVRRLQEAGHAAYFAGGCVRDRLLGQEPEDYDIATEAHPDVVADMFRGTRRVGESFGVMLVRSQGHVIQVATFRSEGAYSDHRHPDEVIFGARGQLTYPVRPISRDRYLAEETRREMDRASP